MTNASEISIAGMNIFPKELEAKKRYRKNVVKYGNMLADICSYEYDQLKNMDKFQIVQEQVNRR